MRRYAVKRLMRPRRGPVGRHQPGRIGVHDTGSFWTGQSQGFRLIGKSIYLIIT